MIRELNAFYDGEISVLSHNDEKCISVRKSFHTAKATNCWGHPEERFIHFEFKDSYLFMGSSLDSLSRSLIEEDFTPLQERFGKDWKMHTGKQVFPYRFLKGKESLGYEGLVPKEEFGSRLGRGEVFEKGGGKGVEVRSISDEDYEQYKRVMQTFCCKTLGDYVKLYCGSDVELLSIIFDRFIRICLSDFGLDPSKSYMAPGFFNGARITRR